MEPKDFVEKLKAESKRRNAMVDQIQEIYEQWELEKQEAVFESMLQLLDAYCGPWVRRKLQTTGCYTDEEENTALQEARLSVWKKVSQESLLTEGKFAYLAFDIYKKRTYDVVRRYCSGRKRYGEIASLDEPQGKGTSPLGWNIPDKQQDLIEESERRAVYHEAFSVYCEALTDASFFPPSCLALFYSRICPHVLSIYHSVTTIPDSKGASAKWAMETMKNKTVGCLANSSEQLMQKEVDEDLHWGAPFSSQLGNLTETSHGPAILRDVVYTAEYSKEKTEDWAEYAHKAILKETLKRIVKDPSLCGRIREYAENSKLSFCLERGGATK